MSNVRENERREGRLQVLTDARELCLYTLHILKNQKVFDRETDATTIEELRKCATDIYKLTYRANSVRVNSSDDWALRDSYQREAIALCSDILVLIGISKSLYHLKSTRIKYWSDMVVNLINKLRRWNESDSARYTK